MKTFASFVWFVSFPSFGSFLSFAMPLSCVSFLTYICIVSIVRLISFELSFVQNLGLELPLASLFLECREMLMKDRGAAGVKRRTQNAERQTPNALVACG